MGRRWVTDGVTDGSQWVCDGEEPGDVARKHRVSEMLRAASLSTFCIRGSELAGRPRSWRRDGAASQDNTGLAIKYQKCDMESHLLLFGLGAFRIRGSKLTGGPRSW